jgi:intracellular multiplication protein IcmO
MTLVTQYALKEADRVRDIRPAAQRIATVLKDTDMIGIQFMLYGLLVGVTPKAYLLADLFLLLAGLQWWWMMVSGRTLSLKMPAFVKGMTDPKNPIPGKGTPGKPEGIFYLGKDMENGSELWISNNDARTHLLYLGTTGSGKTEGLKSMVANALCWGSGYSYTDGKADTDLWASLYAMARRFGRDDDLLRQQNIALTAKLDAQEKTLRELRSNLE